MIKSYLKIAWRNLVKSKSFSLLNIVGLAVGMAAAILIMLWIQNEIRFDRFYSKSDRLYLMYNRDTFSGEKWAWNNTPKIMASFLKKDYPEVEDAVRLSGSGFLLTVGEKKLQKSGSFVDSTFLEVFDLPMKLGNTSTALDDPYNIVITEDLAISLFGKEEAIGKIIRIDNKDNFTVTGVLENPRNDTRFQAEYYLPWSYFKKRGWDDEWWGNNSVNTYVLLKKNSTVDRFNGKVRTITIDHTKGTDQDASTTEVFAYPLSQTYLYGKSENGLLVEGRIVTVRLFGIIAGFILLIACINFMNLSTARSEKRAKEVGIRKVVGALKSALIFQFIGESILLALFAGLLAVLMVQISIPAFNTLVDKRLFLDFTDPVFYIQLLGFIFFTGIVAGSYPAFFLSSFQPVKVLKGKGRPIGTALDPRKVLVVTQFTFAILLIISTLIIRQQIRYAQDREMGYTKENLIYVSLQGEIDKHFNAIRQALVEKGAAVAVTKSMSPITQQWSDSWGFSWPGSTEEDKKLDFGRFSSDADFTKAIGTSLVAGRDIDIYTYPSDSNAILLNETAVKKMRLEEPLGQTVKGDGRDLRVVGIVKDFIINSPYEPIGPMIIMGPASWFNIMHIKLNPVKSTADGLKIVEKVLAEYNPAYPFEYHFVDDAYEKKFENTQRTGTLASLFAGLTILISCLGLFGLSAYMAANRIKEIGVRKVMGASVMNISVLLSKDFLKLIIISFVIASPIAFYLMDKWLEDYKYRIDISPWVFVGAGGLSIFIAIMTVSFQAIKAAVANPVKSLRAE
jgi:putative ABC transport system permease protein